MNKPYGIIYRATNVINGKCYIGQTAGSLNDRKNTHIRYAYRKNSMCIFHRALRKYGIQNFIWEILCECESKPILNVIETFKIIVNNSHWTENGYNMTWGGDGVPFGNKPWNKGIKKCFSEEALLKSRKSHQKHSDESIEKIRELRKQGYSWKKISNITSIPDRTIRDYCKDIKIIQDPKFSNEIKEFARKMRKEGNSWSMISKELNIGMSTIRKWCKCG